MLFQKSEEICESREGGQPPGAGILSLMALPKEATPLIWKKRWSWAGEDENGWGKDIEAKSMNNMCKGTTV